MSRILLTVLVLAIGYDAVVHEGAYTRSIWSSVVGLTGAAVDSVRQHSDQNDNRPPSN